MSPLTVFVRTLLKTTAIFIGVTSVFLNPSLDWSATRTAVTAQNSPRDAAIEALVSALSDPDAGVRSQAAVALGQFRSPRAVQGLLDALSGKDTDLRLRVITALGCSDGRGVGCSGARMFGCSDVRMLGCSDARMDPYFLLPTSY